MKKLLILLFLIPLFGICQENIVGLGFNLLPVLEQDSTGKPIFYYANSKGMYDPIKEGNIYIVEQSTLEAKEQETIVICYL